MTGQQGVNRALYQLAGRSLVDCQYDLAIRALVAVLENEPDPDDFAQCSLDLARIYIENTEDTQKAQERLLQLVCLTVLRLAGRCSVCFLIFTPLQQSELSAACAHQGSPT